MPEVTLYIYEDSKNRPLMKLEVPEKDGLLPRYILLADGRLFEMGFRDDPNYYETDEPYRVEAR